MPNRYLPSQLSEMVAERHDALLDRQSKGDDGDGYVAEYEALVSMLKPEHQEEFQRRKGDLDE